MTLQPLAVKISVITINYNNNVGLEKTMKSVLSQDCPRFEYIVIDGGSTDGSVDIIKKHSEKLAFWTSEKDNGIYNAMNKGIKRATGDYCMFLNSGDELFDADTIEKCLAGVAAPETDILYGDILLVNSAIELQNNTIKKMPATLDVNFFKSQTINHQASLFKRALFEELGLYPEKYKLASDYWLYLKSMAHDKVFTYLDFPLVKYDLSGVSASSFDKYQGEMKAIWESTVPKMVQDISRRNDELVAENQELKSTLQYKLVRMAVRLNELYQQSKSRS